MRFLHTFFVLILLSNVIFPLILNVIFDMFRHFFYTILTRTRLNNSTHGNSKRCQLFAGAQFLEEEKLTLGQCICLISLLTINNFINNLLQPSVPSNYYLFKVNNRNTRKKCERNIFKVNNKNTRRRHFF